MMLGGMVERKRLVGISLLRVFAMLMIVMLHLLGHGGVLDATVRDTPQYGAAWLLEVAAYSAVDIFGLISGYVGYGGRHGLSAAVRLCCTTLFFCVLVTGFALAFGVRMGPAELIGSLVPPAIGKYWYLTSYLCLYPFMPLLDMIVDRLSETKARVLVGVIVALLCIVPTLIMNDFAGTKRGYSACWLAALYVLGACARRHGWFGRLQGLRGLSLYTIAVLFAFASKLVIESITSFAFGKAEGGSMFVKYDSPLILLAAVALVGALSRDDLFVGHASAVEFWSTSAFSVFLLHCAPVLMDVYAGAFGWVAALPAWQLVGLCLGICLATYTICTLVDKARSTLFDALDVDGAIGKLDVDRFRIV